MRRQYIYLLLFLLGIFTACAIPSNESLHGNVLLWHSWNESGAEALTRLIDEFHAIHPETHIIAVAVPPDQLFDRYRMTAQLGLGPDLILAPSTWLPELADEDLVRPLLDQAILEAEFVPAAGETLNYKGQMYGLPLAMTPVVLFVNKKLAPQPAQTLDELLAQASTDKPVGLNTSFDVIYWGIQAMGDSIFTTDGTLNLADSGLELWLNWLAKARETPGMVLSHDDETMRLFANGELAYYIAGPELLPYFREILGEDKVTIVQLPAGDAGKAGPIMATQALLFNPTSTKNQTVIALSLANFLTSAEQGSVLMRTMELAPANRHVRVSQRIYPVASNVYRQGKTAVALPTDLNKELWIQSGNAMVASVVSGELTSREAICLFGQDMAQNSNLKVDLSTCPDIAND